MRSERDISARDELITERSREFALDADDTTVNDRALRLGERIMSAYRIASVEKIWVSTEADRTLQILFPAKY